MDEALSIGPVGIGVGMAFWHSNMSGMGVGIETAPAYAEQDTMVALVMEDSL